MNSASSIGGMSRTNNMTGMGRSDSMSALSRYEYMPRFNNPMSPAFMQDEAYNPYEKEKAVITYEWVGILR